MSEEPAVNNCVELIEGFRAIRDYFGRFPCFHDAEIVEIHLNREGLSWLRVYTGVDGFHPKQKPGTVVFHLNEVLNLELWDCSCQNVVSLIHFEKTEKGIKMSLGPCYGMAGWIEASSISAELIIGNP